jgi:hypothetical protein
MGIADALDALTTLDIEIAHAPDDATRDALSDRRERLAARLPAGETEKPAVEQLRKVNEELFFSDIEMKGAIAADASDTTIANIAKRTKTLQELRSAIKATFVAAPPVTVHCPLTV